MGIEFGKTNDDKIWGKSFLKYQAQTQELTDLQVNNIRELLGHRVDLNFIMRNPAVRLEKK